MNIRLHAIVDDSIVDGPGIRLTVFTQGCPHHCPGCHNPQTHDPMGGAIWDTGQILKRVNENPLLDGITLSGGEPFLQSDACAHLAKAVKKMGLNVWTYTGYTFEELLKEADSSRLELLENTDVLVDGKFIQSNRSLDLLFRGSQNQRILLCNKSLHAHQLLYWQEPIF